MENEKWQRVLDNVPHEARASFEAMRTHFGDVYSGTLEAFLAMLGGVESKLDTAIAEWLADTNDRRQVAEFLQRIIDNLTALSSEVAMLRSEVSTLRTGQERGDKERKQMQRRLTKIERDLRALQEEVATLKARA